MAYGTELGLDLLHWPIFIWLAMGESHNGKQISDVSMPHTFSWV